MSLLGHVDFFVFYWGGLLFFGIIYDADMKAIVIMAC